MFALFPNLAIGSNWDFQSLLEKRILETQREKSLPAGVGLRAGVIDIQ